MSNEKYGFVYIWYDRKHKRYYIGCRWGNINDGYVCSSSWMKQAFGHRPKDFKRRILKTNIPTRHETYIEEQRWLNMIKPEEIKPINDNARYYNLCITNNKVWHTYEENIKTVGQKISQSKKGKSTGPMTEERKRNISEAKKKKFEEKQKLLGYKFDPDHTQKLSDNRKGKGHTEEWKRQNSERLKEQWLNGTRKRAEPKQTMTKEEQAQLTSKNLKSRWQDPIWRENQIAKLKEAKARKR
jgi:hypothetical protein